MEQLNVLTCRTALRAAAALQPRNDGGAVAAPRRTSEQRPSGVL